MRKIIFACILILTIYSCNKTKNQDSISFNKNLLWGEWHLDSVSNGVSDFQTLFITKNHQFHLFSYSLGNQLILYGCYKEQKLFSQYDMEYQIIQLDSNRLVLNDELNKTKLFYRKSLDNNIEKRLKNALEDDKLRSKLIGWWKYTKPAPKSNGLRFVSRNFYAESFIMNIREDGGTEIFENFKTSTPLLFNYRVKNKFLTLQEGCIITSLDIVSIEEDKLTVSADGMNLELGRIIQFN